MVGRQEGHPACKNWVLVCFWRHFDWSFALLIAPVVNTTSITLGSNKIQNGDILVPINLGPPGKWLLKRRESHGDDVLCVMYAATQGVTKFWYVLCINICLCHAHSQLSTHPFPFGCISFVVLVMRKGGESS